MARIGFVGLGNMGGPMARNLLKAGHQVAGYDLVPAALEAFAAAGGTPAASAAAAATGAEFVVTMLPAGKHVRDAWLGAGGMAAASAPAAILMDCSTIDVDTARAVAAEAGRPMLDAPVAVEQPVLAFLRASLGAPAPGVTVPGPRVPAAEPARTTPR